MHYDATEALPEFVFDVDLDRPIPSLKSADAEPPALLFPKTAGWLTGETVEGAIAPLELYEPAEMFQLELYEKFISITGDDFTVENVADTSVMKVIGFDTHMALDLSFGKYIALVSQSGESWFGLVREQCQFIAKVYHLKAEDKGEVLATVRKRLVSWWPTFDVYEGEAAFDWCGRTEAKPLYRVDGNLAEWSFRILEAAPTGAAEDTPRRLCARVCQKLHAMKAVAEQVPRTVAPFSGVVTCCTRLCGVACNEERDMLSYVGP